MLSLDDIEAASEESWSSQKRVLVGRVLARINGWISRNAPCLVGPTADPDSVAIADGIVQDAVLRQVVGRANVASQSVGPANVEYADRAALPPLTNADMEELRALCDAGVWSGQWTGSLPMDV